jgi:Fe-S cluster assembly protein SufD
MPPAPPKPAVKDAGRLLAAFDRLEREEVLKSPAWLFALRKAGIAKFAQLGIPTTQHEDWRFTSLAGLAKLPLTPLVPASAQTVPAATLSGCTFARLAGPRLVFVNGCFAEALSSIGPLPPGVNVTSMGAALAAGNGPVQKHLGRHVTTDDNAFAALNTALFTDGAFIHISAGRAVEAPVQLLFLTTARDSGTTIQPRNLILAEAGSRLTVIENHLSIGAGGTFTNALTELVAGEEAVVEHLKFQDEGPETFHIATLHGEFGRRSRVNLHSFALGARLSRYNIRAKLNGEGLEAVLNGLYLTRGEQLADHHMIVEHARPNCASHEYFNGILDDRSKGVFHGRILVRPIAQKTDAKQTNKNLLLSDEATVDTKPQLEIYADDVKCTHGATVGQMNDEAIFYLRSRGIGLERARRMLMLAFAGEITDRVQCEAVREELAALIWKRLAQHAD